MELEPVSDPPLAREYDVDLYFKAADVEARLLAAQQEIAQLQKRCDEAEQACVAHAAHSTWLAGEDIPETIDRARLALLQRCEQAEANRAAAQQERDRLQQTLADSQRDLASKQEEVWQLEERLKPAQDAPQS